MKNFDRFVLLFLVVLLGLILLLVLQGDRIGVQVTAVIPANGERVGIFGPIGIQFSQQMDQTSVEAHFSLSPMVTGRFEWEENILWFFPETTFDPDQVYQLSLSAGAQSANGRTLLKTQHWTLSISSQDILYLILVGNGGELWLWDSTNNTTRSLTNTGNLIIDYSPSKTGEWIAYSVENGENGSDLWLVNYNGTEHFLLLSCGSDFCSQPDWSPDGKWIAYARQTYDPEKGQIQPSRIWTVNIASSETTPLYKNEETLGQMPSFSPDGTQLASYDPILDGIRILNLETSKETIIPTSLEEMGDWSADGKSLLFIDLLPSALEPEVIIYIADLENENILQALGGDAEATSFSQPRWSPDSNWIAVGLRPVNSTANKALWVLKTDGSEAIAVTNEPSANFSSYHWDPWGESLVYQRLGFNLQPSVWIWDIDGAARPQWLP
jgi:Tol biopolymer transport system component